MQSNKTNIILTFLAAFALLSFSCRKDQTLASLSSEKQPALMSDGINFVLRVAGLKTPASYASANKENEINEIALLAFKKDGNTFKFEKHFNITGADISLSQSGAGTDVLFSKALQLAAPASEYVLAIVANPSAALKARVAGFSKGMLKADAMKKLIVSQADIMDVSGNTYTLRDGIPMYCEIGPKVFTNGEKISGYDFTRMLAKIEIRVNDPNFALSSVELHNYSTQGLLAGACDANGILSPSSNQANIPGTGGKQSSNSAFYRINNGSLSEELYAFESAAASEQNGISAAERKDAICLLLYGYNKQGTDKGFYYYRVDFTYDGKNGQKAEYMPVLRNYKYLVNIDKIEGTGYQNSDEALNDLSVKSNSRVRIITYNLADDIKSFVYNGQWTLGTDLDTLHFQDAADTKTLKIYTDYINSWRPSSNGFDDISSGSPTPATWGTCTPAGSDALRVSLDANTTSKARSGLMTLRAGRLMKQIVIIQDARPAFVFNKVSTSNCYILKANDTKGIAIPVIRANESLVGQQLHSNDAFTAELLWTDNQQGIGAASTIKSISVSGSGPSGYLNVVPGAAEGNALVAIKDHTGKILWSWHIWVLKSPPATIGNKYMDRNLGALSASYDANSFGLLYQWGRKDPFPGGTNSGNLHEIYDAGGKRLNNHNGLISSEQALYPDNLAEAIAHPTTYIFGNDQIFDWASNYPQTNHLHEDLWNTSSKSVYDPCPEGYQVADEQTFTMMTSSDLSTTGSHLYIDAHKQDPGLSGLFYPAAGAIHRLTQTSSGVAYTQDGGYYWINRAGYGGRFQAGNYQGLTSMHKENGCAVRCVKK